MIGFLAISVPVSPLSCSGRLVVRSRGRLEPLAGDCLAVAAEIGFRCGLFFYVVLIPLRVLSGVGFSSTSLLRCRFLVYVSRPVWVSCPRLSSSAGFSSTSLVQCEFLVHVSRPVWVSRPRLSSGVGFSSTSLVQCGFLVHVSRPVRVSRPRL